MNANRIFICNTIYPDNQQDAQILNYLIQSLQGAGIEVITNKVNSADAEFFQFLRQELPTCRAFILFQTSTAIRSSQVNFAVSRAQMLTGQKNMRHIVRFISTSDNTDIVSASWKALTTFDGTRDYKRAIEKLLLLLTTSTDALLNKSPQVATPVAPPPTRVSSPKIVPRTDYDRPGIPPSKLKILGDEGRPRRRLLIRILIILIIITIIGSASAIGFLFLRHEQPAAIVRQAYFFSSNQMGTDNTTIGMCDMVQVNLQNITSPAAGNSYYAWLLPDLSKQEGITVALGKLTINNGTVHLTYTDPKHTNLLLAESRFLITEEKSNSTPIAPSPDRQNWRYYNEIPQAPNPKDPNHFSDLDHIRHLLGEDPLLQQLSMQGGLNTWFYQNIQQIFQWATMAQEGLQNPDPNSTTALNSITDNDAFHDNILRILEYLDGKNNVAGDEPTGTQLKADVNISRMPLLTTVANQNPPGYIYHIQIHMQGITGSPGATTAQQTLAGKIDAELNKVNALLEKARQDAKKLAFVADDQPTTLATTVLTNDLVNNVTSAFIGQLDTNTGAREGGATWVHDIMPQLATFDIQPYTSTTH